MISCLQQHSHLATIACLVATLALMSIMGIRTMSSSPQLINSTVTVAEDQHRILRKKLDPHSTQLKVPKIVHFTIANNPPEHQMKVLEYSMKLIESYGFDTMIHRDSDCDKLIRDQYPALVQTWEVLLNNKGADKGARIGDFVRILLIFHYGGVYMDADMVPCQDLTELVNVPGVATFPQINTWRRQILNSAFSAPPGHMVFWTALEIMQNNPNFMTEHILFATGPGMLANAVTAHFANINTPPIVNFEERDDVPVPPKGSIWVTRGDIRFGAVDRFGREHTRGMATRGVLGLLHLHWRSWVTGGRFKDSECEEDLDLIPVFINYSCNHIMLTENVRWSSCGDGSEQSGMLGDDTVTKLVK